MKTKLIGGFNPSEKYESKWESSPGRDGNKKIFETTTQKIFELPPTPFYFNTYLHRFLKITLIHSPFWMGEISPLMTHPSHERVPLVDAIVMPSQGRSAKVGIDETCLDLYPSLKLTACLHLKINAWNAKPFPFEAKRPIFRGRCHVSFHGV